MSRAGGRRIARATAPVLERTRSPRVRPALLAIVLVALAGGAIAVAGTTTEPTGVAEHVTQHVALSQRELSCAGGIAGAQADSGVASVRGVTGGVLTRNGLGSTATSDSPTSTDLKKPLQIVADQNVAAGVYGSELARGAKWLAFEPCPEPRATWWFVGVGGSTVHDTVLTVTNPREGSAIFDISVVGPNGPITAPGLKGLTLPSGATKTFDLGKLSPAIGDLAVNITASRGLVSASAADRRSPATGKPVSEWVAPQPAAAKRLDLTGLPAKTDQATLLISNQSSSATIANLQVVGSSGTFTPKEHPTVSLPPGAVVSVPVDSFFDGKPLAIRVTAPQPVVATVRSVVNGDISYASAASALAGSSVAAVPAAVHAELRLSSLGKRGAVTLTAYDKRDRAIERTEVAVPAGSAVRATLPARARYIVVTASAPQTIGALLISDSHGIGEGVLSPAAVALRLPIVRPGG